MKSYYNCLSYFSPAVGGGSAEKRRTARKRRHGKNRLYGSGGHCYAADRVDSLSYFCQTQSGGNGIGSAFFARKKG